MKQTKFFITYSGYASPNYQFLHIPSYNLNKLFN